MEPFYERLQALEQTVTDPAERIDAWIALQLEIAAGPCHAMSRLLGEIPRASQELHQQLAELHEPPAKILRHALEQLLAGTDRDIELLTKMITSMVQSVAGLAMGKKNSRGYVDELQFSVQRILQT
jgi:hypothetical protein